MVADLLASGASWLASQLEAAAGRVVVYKRGNSQANITATVGASRFEAAGQSGVVEQWESRDFVVRSQAMPFGEPQRHDRIVDMLNGVSVSYEVASPRGVPVWHWGDAHRATMRIHTTAVDEGIAISATYLLRWYGASALTALTDAQIVAQLASDMADSRVQSRVIASNGQYLYIVLPTSFGTPLFSIGGLASTAWETTTRQIAFVGQSARSYTVYRSTYPLTGTISVSAA